MATSLLAVYLLTTRLGPAQYGYFAGVQAMIAILATLSYTWVALLLIQEIVRERRVPSEVFRSSVALAGLTGFAALGAALTLAPLLLPGLLWQAVLLFAVAEFAGFGAVGLSSAVLIATDHFSGSVIVRMSLLLSRAVVIVALGLTGQMTLLSLSVGYCAVSVVVGAATLIAVSRRLSLSLRPRLPPWTEAWSGLSYAGTQLGQSLQEDADKVLLVRFGDPVTAGLYAAAYRAVQMGTLPIKSLVGASHRRFLVDDPTRRREHVKRSLNYTGAASLYSLAAVVLLIAAAPLVPRILGDGYTETAAMIPWLAPLILFRALNLFAFNGLMGLRRNGVRFWIIVVSALVAVLGGVLLIPIYSWRGAVAATLLAEVVFIVGAWASLLYFQRRHDRRVGMRRSQLTAR